MEGCFREPLSSIKQLETFSYSDSSSTDSFRLTTAASYQDDDIVAPHPSQRPALPDVAAFQDAPLIITQDPRARSQVVGTDPRGHVPINVSVPVETDTFVGRMCSSIKGCPGTSEAEFRGTKLLGSSIIQGMFKEPMAAEHLWVGQELLNKPLLPTSFQRLVFTTAAKLFSSTYKVMVEGDGDAVGYLNPLLAMASVINVSLPGQQPDLRSATEDMRLFDSSLVDKSGQPLSSAQRQRYFDKPSNLDSAMFSTGHVYTFVITQSIVDMEAYRLKLGAFINLDLCPVLNGQPLQMMCKNVRTDELFLGLLVWHKHLNYPQGKKQPRESDADSTSCHSQYTTSSGASSLCTSSSMVSSLCTNSSIGSISSIDSSSSSFSSGSRDEGCSGCEFESDAECESDYHSCIDDADHHHSQSVLQHELMDSTTTTSSSSGSSSGVQQPVYRPLAAAAVGQQHPLLEPAFSAPADLTYLCGTQGSSSSSDVPSGATLETDARTPDYSGNCAAAGSKGGSQRGKAKRKSAGGKAVAAVAYAARRMAARFKARPGLALRRNVSCPGSAL